jgi:hypothetical protein
MAQIRWAREPWPPGGCIQLFSKDKEFRAFEMLEKIGFSPKPRRCVNYFKERNAQRRRKSRCRFSVCRREDTKPSFQRGHSESSVSPPRKGIVTKRCKSGSFALSLVACPDFRFLLCTKTRQRNQGRGMALRVFNYSQAMSMSP